MNAITIKFLAMTVAFAVLLTFSAPTQAALYATPSSTYAGLQGDDEDEGLSGGALAVLLLAVGGAVARDLDGPGSIRTRSTLSLNRVSASKAIVQVERRRKTTSWTSVLDPRSGTIWLSSNGIKWKGKTDGRFYAIEGDPTADELYITTVNNRSLEFRTKKAGRVGYGGTITISDNGQTVSMNTDGRGSRQVVFSAR